jgi:hypothetical protein
VIVTFAVLVVIGDLLVLRRRKKKGSG